MTVTIRDARIADAAAIAEFNSRIAGETENLQLDADTLDAGVRKLLHDPSLGRYWVAESGNTVVGQIMTTFEWSDWRDGLIWWIQSVYVRQDFRRRGVFSQLYSHVEHRARTSSGVVGLRLYVDKDNVRAQETYLRLGMAKTDYEVMEQMFR